MEACEFCQKLFDSQTHRYRLTPREIPALVFGVSLPSARFKRAFTVRCPHCGCTYVSTTLRRWGFVTYQRLLIGFFTAVILFIAWAWFGR